MDARARKIKRWKRRAVNFVWGVCGVVAAPFVYNWLEGFIKSDPFVGMYARKTEQINESIGIRMDGVELRDFQGAKLVSSAFANRVDVRKDRQAATLYGVRNGLYNGDQGPVTYSASQAVWNFQTKQVVVNKHVSVKNKDIDLTAAGLTFDDRSNLLHVQGNVSGKLYKGDVTASTLIYNMKTGAADAGPVTWHGNIELSPQDDNTAKPHKWNISSAHMRSLGTKTDLYEYINATAGDEDLIVVAPKVQQNRKTDVLTAEGGIQYYSGKADITADTCIVYRKEKRVVLMGHVFMYVKPKAQEDDPPKVEKLPDFTPIPADKVVAMHNTKALSKDDQKEKEEEIRSSKNLRDYPLVVVSAKIEYWYGKGDRHAVVTGAPQGRQALKNDEWRYVWSHTALYDGEKETLKLVSSDAKTKDALMKNSLGDAMKAIDILVSTKEDDDYVEASEQEGWIYTNDEDIPKDDKKKSTPPPTGGAVKGGGAGGGSGSSV